MKLVIIYLKQSLFLIFRYCVCQGGFCHLSFDELMFKRSGVNLGGRILLVMVPNNHLRKNGKVKVDHYGSQHIQRVNKDIDGAWVLASTESVLKQQHVKYQLRNVQEKLNINTNNLATKSPLSNSHSDLVQTYSDEYSRNGNEWNWKHSADDANHSIDSLGLCQNKNPTPKKEKVYH